MAAVSRYEMATMHTNGVAIDVPAISRVAHDCVVDDEAALAEVVK
jgi:hypothetical protein